MSWLTDVLFTRRRNAEARAELYADWLRDEREEKETALRNLGRMAEQLAAKDETIAALRARLDRVQPKPQDPRRRAAANGVKP
jgi:membrane protein involved in colicin uptake